MNNSNKRNFIFSGIAAVLMAVTLLACPSPTSPSPPVVEDTTSPVVAGTPEQEPNDGSTDQVALRFIITEENAVSYVSGVTDDTLKTALGSITVGGTSPSSEAPVIDSVTLDAANKKIVITLADGTELIKDNTLTIIFPANIIQDDAGNKNIETTLVVTVVEDITAPALKTVTASDSSRNIVLTFDEYVTNNNTVTELKDVFTVYSDGSDPPSTEITVTAVAGDRTETITLTLADDLTAGNKIQVDINTGLSDLAGNAITSIISETVTVADGTSPELSSISADDSKAEIVLTFSEAVTATTSDFTVTLRAAGSTLLRRAINSIAGSGSETITLSLAETPAANSIIKVLVGIGVKDAAGNSVADGSEKSVIVADKTAPTLEEIKTDNNRPKLITLIFSEAVEAEADDFTVHSDGSDPPTTPIAVSTVSGSGSEIIELTLASDLALGDKLKISVAEGLTDVFLGGGTPNSIEPIDRTVTIANDTEAPTLLGMDEPNDASRQIVLRFSEAVNTATASASDFTVTSDDQDPPTTANAVQSFTGSGRSSITLTLTEDLIVGNKVKVIVSVVNIQDIAGNNLAMTGAEATGTVVDLSPPTLDSLFAGDSSRDITLTFSESVAADPGHFTVTSGSSANAVVSASGSGSSSITLTLTDDLIAGETLRVYVLTGLADNAGNPIAAGTTETTVVADATPPTLTGLTASDDAPRSAILTFSEKVVGAITGGFTVYSGTAADPTTVISVTALSGDGTDRITLTLAEDLITNENIKVDIADGALTDASKNPIAAASSLVETVTDKTAPMLTELSANSGTSQAKLTFSEPVTAEAADFEVYSDEDASLSSPNAVESVEGSGTADITLNLANELVSGEKARVIVLDTLTDIADTPHSIQQTTKFVVIADKSLPTLEKVIPGAAKQVMLRFSESVKAVQTDFTVYSDTNADPSTQNDITGITGSYSDVITLALTSDLVEGQYLKVDVGTGVLDFADNAVAADTSMTVSIATDNTPPTLSSISTHDYLNEVVLTFDEAVIAAIGDFTVYADGNANPATENTVVGIGGSGSEEIKLRLSDDLMAGHNIKVEVAATLTDIAGNQIAGGTAKTAAIADKRPPTVNSVSADNSGGAKVVIRFSEPVTAETGDFSVQSGPSSASYTDNPVTGIAGTDTDTVTLTLQNNLIAGEFVRVTVNSGLTDSTGNAIIVTQRTESIADVIVANLQEISANNAPVPQVVLTFDKPVRKAVDIDFTVTSGPEGALFRNPVTDLTGNNTDTITLTLTVSLTADEKINVVISDVNDDLIADANQTADISDVVAPAPVAVEPILADDVVVNGNNGKVVIKFDEAVYVDLNHFHITSDSKANPTAHNPITGSTGDGTEEIALTLENELTAGEKIKVLIEERGITDASGNAMASWSGVATISDKTPPSLLRILANPANPAASKTVFLIFSESVYTVVQEDFTVTSGSSDNPTTTSYTVDSVIGVYTDEIELTLTSSLSTTDQSIKVVVGTNLEDDDGNTNTAPLELTASLAYDTTPPTLESISADDSAREVVLTFSELVSTGTNDYEVYSGGVTAPYALNPVVDLASDGEFKIVLTLGYDLLAGENIRVVVKNTLTDVYGNPIAAGTEKTGVIANVNPPVLESIAASSDSTVRGAVLTFSEAVRAVKSDFTVSTGPVGALVPNEVIAITGDGTDTITLFLSVDPTDESYMINVAVKTTVSNLAGLPIAPGTVLEGDISRPEYRSVSTIMTPASRGSDITLQFSEDIALKTGEALSASDFNVYSDVKVVPDAPVNLSGAAFAVSGDTITITLADAVWVQGGERIKVDITLAGLAKIQDASGNDAKGAVSRIGEVKYAYTPTTSAELRTAVDTEIGIQGNTADLNIIDTSAVTYMGYLFSSFSRNNFNGDISKWNTAKVTSIAYMFDGNTVFNQDLRTDGDTWNTSNVVFMEGVFHNASAFNGDITNWDTGNVTTFQETFASAGEFNQDISGWDTSSAMNMFSMFYGATDFSQDLSGWNVNNLQTMIDFNRESGLGDAQLPNFDDVDLPPIITSKETPLYSGKEIRETTLHFTVGDVDGVAYNGTEGDADNFIDDLKVELFIGTGDFLGVTPTLLMARHSQRTMIDIDLPAGTYIRGNVLRITFPAGLFIDTPAVETGKTKKTSAETAFEFVVQ